MRKLIIALISLVLIGLVGYVLIPIESKTKNFGYSEALNAIPPKASFIIRSDNIIHKWRELSNSTIGKSLSKIKSYSAIQSVFSKIDSTQNEVISSFFNQKVLIDKDNYTGIDVSKSAIKKASSKTCITSLLPTMQLIGQPLPIALPKVAKSGVTPNNF